MMPNSRQKGKRGEREVIKLLQPVMDRVYGQAGLEVPDLTRNMAQARSGGVDIVGIPWLAIEVKHHQSCPHGLVNTWWRQCCSQATDSQIPALFYRATRQPWTVRMWASITVFEPIAAPLQMPADFSLQAFLSWFEVNLQGHITAAQNQLSSEVDVPDMVERMWSGKE